MVSRKYTLHDESIENWLISFLIIYFATVYLVFTIWPRCKMQTTFSPDFAEFNLDSSLGTLSKDRLLSQLEMTFAELKWSFTH